MPGRCFRSVPCQHWVPMWTEVVNAALPQSPDVVVDMSPTNNLTASRAIVEAAADFGMFLRVACSHLPNVGIFSFIVFIMIFTVFLIQQLTFSCFIVLHLFEGLALLKKLLLCNEYILFCTGLCPTPVVVERKVWEELRMFYSFFFYL